MYIHKFDISNVSIIVNFIIFHFRTTPKLYTFNSTNMDKLHGHHVSFLPFESSPDGVYHTTVLVTNTYNSDPKQHEFDVCLIVSEQDL